MNENNPLNPIIKQLNDLLSLCDEEFKKKEPAPGGVPRYIIKQVKDLETRIQIFKEAADSVIKESKEEMKQVEVAGKKNIPLPEQPSEEQQEFLKKLEQIEKEIALKRLALAPQVQKAKKEEEVQQKKERMRKKKFIGLNPRGKWQKL